MVTLKQGYISKELLADLMEHATKLGHSAGDRFLSTYVQRDTAEPSTSGKTSGGLKKKAANKG